MYGGLDPKIINNTCDTEENGIATYIEGNPINVIIVKPLRIGGCQWFFPEISTQNRNGKES